MSHLSEIIQSTVISCAMPDFFSRRRKSHLASVGNCTTLPHLTASPNNNNSFVQQKIHPDLNSLAEELTSSQGHDLERNPELNVEETGFIGLEPSTRRSHRKNAAHTRAQQPEQPDMESEYQQIAIPRIDLASNRETSRLPGTNSSGSPTSITAPSRKKRWSIFGRNYARVPHRNSDASNATGSASRSRTQSTSSQPRSHSTQGPAEASQPRTPKSQYSMYNSTHHTGSTPSYNLGGDDLMPSPHTFGVPTPPQAGSTNDNPYFGFTETPPPLPPLVHPAFRQGSKSSTNDHFPIQYDAREKFPRHSHSLPSLAHSDTSDIKAARKRHRRASSRSNKFEVSLRRQELPSTIDKMNKKQHNRSDSVTSSMGTRRSSAEYSAMKALSAGHEDRCWEVQVSKEMIRLALDQGTRDHATSSFGNARGKNVGFLFNLLPYHPISLPFIFLAFSFFFFHSPLAGAWRGVGAWFTISFARYIPSFGPIEDLADAEKKN